MTSASHSSTGVFHPDFTTDGDIELVTRGGVRFIVQSTALARASGFFRAMFTDAKPDSITTDLARERHAIAVDEDAHTLEVVLKIVCALPYVFAQIDNMDMIERVANAADKYNIPAVLNTLQLLMYAPVTRPHVLRRYVLATRFGWDGVCADMIIEALDIEIDFEELSPSQVFSLTGLMRIQRARVRRFADFLNDKALFNSGNSELCPSQEHELKRPTPWESLKVALVLELIRKPSGKTLFSANKVFLDAARDAACSECGTTLYNWPITIGRIANGLDSLPTNLD